MKASDGAGHERRAATSGATSQLEISLGNLRASCDAAAMSSSALVLLRAPSEAAGWYEAEHLPVTGLVLELGAAQAGGLRMLTARSPLQVRNDTACELSIGCGFGGSSAVAEAKCSIGVDQSWPMPIEFTQTAGTETATWELRVRPVGSDASDGQHLPWKAARLRRWTPRFALLVCDSEAKADEASAEAGGESKSRLPWIAVVCVHDQLLPVASEAAVESDPADPTGLSGEATAEDVSRMEPAAGTAGSARELRRFGLPPSEILVERMCCLLRQQCTADMAQLYITSGFLCYEQTNKHEAVAWSEVDAIYAPRGLGRKDEIVASLSDGRELIFSFFGITSRVKRLQRLRAVRTRGRRLLCSPAAPWRPRELHLLAPLTLLSRLPFTVSFSLRQIEVTEQTNSNNIFGRALGRAWDALAASPRLKGMRQLMRTKSSRFSSHESSTEDREGSRKRGPPLPPPASDVPPVEVKLPPNVPQRVHSFHATSPLRLQAWVGGPSYDDCLLHGHVDVTRPEMDGHEPICLGLHLHPPNEKLSARSVDLVVELTSSSALCATLTVYADHWLKNYSSVPVEVHGARGGGKVVTAPAASSSSARVRSMIFSLESDSSFARLAIARTDARESDASGEMSSLVRDSLRDSEVATLSSDLRGDGGGRFSSPFRVAATSDFDMPLTVPRGDGSGGSVELSLTVINGNGGSLVSELQLHDRFAMLNSASVDIEWREVRSRGGGGGASAASNLLQLSRLSGGGESTGEGALLPTGAEHPLNWRLGDKERLLELRVAGGAYDWCSPISANEAGAFVLKCRPLRPETGAHTAYLRLSVQTISTRTRLTVRSLRSDPQLPYRVINPSRLLVAFRQPSTRAWDVLGAGEWTAYTPDDPSQANEQRRLELMLFDPFSTARAHSTASLDTKVASDEGVQLLRLQTACDDSATSAAAVDALMPKDGGSPSQSTPRLPPTWASKATTPRCRPSRRCSCRRAPSCTTRAPAAPALPMPTIQSAGRSRRWRRRVGYVSRSRCSRLSICARRVLAGRSAMPAAASDAAADLTARRRGRKRRVLSHSRKPPPPPPPPPQPPPPPPPQTSPQVSPSPRALAAERCGGRARRSSRSALTASSPSSWCSTAC